MSLRKFQDPETGQEIESTPLARGGAGVVWGLVFGSFGALFCLLLFGTLWGWEWGTLWGVGGGLALGLTGALLEGFFDPTDKVRSDALGRRVHDGIARWQHLRRQRGPLSQPYPHVPDGALSRSFRRASPQETPASLAQADPPPAPSRRLTAGVEATTEKPETLSRDNP